MDITRGTPDGGTLAQLDGDWTLVHDASSGRFGRRFTFALPTAGLADALRWQPSTICALSFPTFDYNALAAGAPEAVTLTNNGSDGVVLTFPFARTVQRVRVIGALGTDLLEARRIDGNAVAKDAFTQAAHGADGAALNATDVQLLLRLSRNGSGVPIRTTNIQQVMVRSVAANIRVGIAIHALSAEVFYLGPDAGAVLTKPATAANVGIALAKLLQSVSDRLTDSLGGNSLPSSVAVTLVIEADSPARAHIASFVLRYRLYRARFADQTPKQLVDFNGSVLEQRQLIVDVPRGTTLASARLRMIGPFRESGSEAQGDTDGTADGSPPPPLPPQQPQASDLGVAVATGAVIANRVQLPRAALIQGVTLTLVAIAETSAGMVHLHADDHGSPGDVLGTVALPALTIGQRSVARVDFVRATPIGAGALWIALQCDSGSLLWLTFAPDATTSDSLVLRREPRQAAWTSVSAAAGRGTMLSLVSASAANSAYSQTATDAFHGVQLRLGAHRLRGAAAGKETHFNVATVLGPLASTTTVGALAPIALTLASSEAARVTIFPPEFEFDI